MNRKLFSNQEQSKTFDKEAELYAAFAKKLFVDPRDSLELIFSCPSFKCINNKINETFAVKDKKLIFDFFGEDRMKANVKKRNEDSALIRSERQS